MVCVPARAGSDKFLPASFHPLKSALTAVDLEWDIPGMSPLLFTSRLPWALRD